MRAEHRRARGAGASRRRGELPGGDLRPDHIRSHREAGSPGVPQPGDAVVEAVPAAKLDRGHRQAQPGGEQHGDGLRRRQRELAGQLL